MLGFPKGRESLEHLSSSRNMRPSTPATTVNEGECADISMKYRRPHKWVDGRVLMKRVLGGHLLWLMLRSRTIKYPGQPRNHHWWDCVCNAYSYRSNYLYKNGVKFQTKNYNVMGSGNLWLVGLKACKSRELKK